jgi:FkbM family methyltransferase
MGIETVVIDAGARYGLHPSWSDLRGLVEFHLFELDEDEATRLKLKYQSDSRITVHPIGLFNSDTELQLKVTAHRALNSVFSVDEKLLQRNDYFVRDFAIAGERRVEVRSIDSFFAGRDVHFMKLDTEGAEYEILKGATGVLETTVLGVRSEVLFAPIYKDAPLFGEIHRLMLDRGFELLNLDYTGAGNKAGRFTLPGRYGKLINSDAVWVVNNDRLFSRQSTRLLHDVVRFAVFLLNNGASDLAVDTLVRAVTQAGVSFADIKDDPLFRALHKKILLLFKALLGLPMLLETDITSTYRAIFDADFPVMNKFYEDRLFE